MAIQAATSLADSLAKAIAEAERFAFRFRHSAPLLVWQDDAGIYLRAAPWDGYAAPTATAVLIHTAEGE